MHRHRLTPLLLLASLTVPVTPAVAQNANSTTLEDVIARVTQAEAELIARTKERRPIVEAYIQELGPEQGGVQMPIVDAYFLGRLEWDDGPVLALMADPRRTEKSASERRGYIPDGFASMAAPDWKSLDKKRYDFKFVRREFLGEVRTIVLDVKPRENPNAGFSGRLWVEDRGYNIVRYNGVNRNVKGPRFRKRVNLHVDGWRVHSGDGTWLPSYVHCEETGLDNQDEGGVVRSQVKLWGYNTAKTDQTQQFTSIQIDAVSDVTDEAQLAPVLSQRRWEQEAELNVIERLEKAGLLAPAGEVEQVLDTVLNNLQATNELALERPVHARVLLTSPLESFTVGHTLVLSRGLIDVLPDEASLAMALAHELSHVVLGHRLIDTKFAFADRMMIGDAELLETISMSRDEKEEAEADAKVVEMLDRSPYKDKLAAAGLFLRIVAERATLLPELIHPHVGDHVSAKADGGLTELMARAPDLNHRDLTQVPALPIGARLVVDPWDGRLELLRSAAALPASMREKMPLAIAPLTPFLKYVGEASKPIQTSTPLPRPAGVPAPVAHATAAAPSPWAVERTPSPASVPEVPSTAPVVEIHAPPSSAPVSSMPPRSELAAPPAGAPAAPPLPPRSALGTPLTESAGVPTIVAVPRLTMPAADKPAPPTMRPVPSIDPDPDRCLLEGTDEACSPGAR